MARLTKKATAQLQEFLAGRSREALIEELLRLAAHDPELRDRLLIEAAQASGSGVDVATFRRSINEALFSFHDDRRRGARTSGTWARRVHASIARLEELLEAGQAQSVSEVCEYALGRAATAMGRVDDSSGYFGLILSSLEDLHHRSCLVARPEPVALAQRLFAAEVDSEWDVFVGVFPRYADVFGDEGVAEFRRLAQERWAGVPNVGPGDPDPERYGSRFQITRMMERIAEHDGDVDALIAVKSRDLSEPNDWLRVAEVLHAAGRNDEALAWAERGVAAFSERHDARLVEFLADAYQRHDRADDAARTAWDAFSAAPSLTGYRRLREHAEQAGAWSEWRDRAYSQVRDDLTDERNTPPGSAPTRGPGRWSPPSVGCVLVEMLLVDGDIETAWEEGQHVGLPRQLWLRLAAARGKQRPAEAIPAFRDEVERLIDGRSKDAYVAAVEVLGQVSGFYLRAGDEAGFGDYVHDLRTRHKAKRNFIDLLDEERW